MAGRELKRLEAAIGARLFERSPKAARGFAGDSYLDFGHSG
jgi:hypothetical protein